MKRILWQLRMLSEWTGWWVLAVIAAFLAAVFWFFMVIPAQQNLELSRSHYAELASRQYEKPVAADASPQVSAVLRSLPSYRGLPQSLSSVFATAREMDVILDIGDYRYVHNHGEAFGRYQIELPVIADYPTIRALVAKLMNDMPYAALDDLSLMREDIDSDLVDARIRLTLFLAEQ